MPQIPNLINVAEAQETAPIAVVSLTTREEMEGYILRESPEQGERIIKVIECESSFNNEAIGDNGNSYGLIQIHRPSHPELSLETIKNVQWELDYIISEFKAGNQNQWSCYRLTK